MRFGRKACSASFMTSIGGPIEAHVRLWVTLILNKDIWVTMNNAAVERVNNRYRLQVILNNVYPWSQQNLISRKERIFILNMNGAACCHHAHRRHGLCDFKRLHCQDGLITIQSHSDCIPCYWICYKRSRFYAKENSAFLSAKPMPPYTSNLEEAAWHLPLRKWSMHNLKSMIQYQSIITGRL